MSDVDNLGERIFTESKIFEEEGKERTATQALKVTVETEEGEREAFLVGTRNLPPEKRQWQRILKLTRTEEDEQPISVQFADGSRELVLPKNIKFPEEQKK